jgi:hypothetical protein
MVRAFRAEMIAEREEQKRRLREALDHFKREVEIETAVLRRLVEVFKMYGSLTPSPPRDQLTFLDRRGRAIICNFH